MNINPTIFRGYDIRGIAGEDLSEEVYYHLGRGYATFLSQRRIKLCPVGYDSRLSSEKYKDSFIKGLNEGGIDTIDIGLSMSQIVYFSSYAYLTKGGAMISASHNPGNYNGLKLSVGYSDTTLSDELQYIRKIIEKEEYSSGKGTNKKDDLFPKYKEMILKFFSLKKKWKVVVDGCNSGSGVFYPDIFRAAGCEVVELNCNIDGNFPLGNPDPTEVHVLERLAKKVVEEKADIGFAYDADGDRMSAVDHTGQTLWMDTIVSLFAQDVLEYLPGSSIVYNTLCSKQVYDTIVKDKGIPLMWITGHSYIKAKVKEARSPFGGELSGHIFFMDNFFGHDDAAYACLRLLTFLERRSESLNEAVSKLPFYVSSPEIKIGIGETIKFKFIEDKIIPELQKLFPKGTLNTIDGARIDMDDGMVIIRASQNGPYLVIKLEGKTKEIYEDIRVKIKNMLKQFSELQWESGSNTYVLS